MIDSAASAISLEGSPSRDQAGCLRSFPKTKSRGLQLQGSVWHADSRAQGAPLEFGPLHGSSERLREQPA